MKKTHEKSSFFVVLFYNIGPNLAPKTTLTLHSLADF